MSIKVQNITKVYGEQYAVNNISFEIKTGEIVGFLGPNGAGKSTTMKMLTGYVKPTSGSAKVCNLDILESPLEIKQKIGYLPESNPLYFDLYIKEYLSFVAGLHQLKNKHKRVADIIGLTGLTREQNKKIGQLSKGYKQRIGLAQAMLHNPDVLILDEPTSGLDPNQLVEIRKLITEIGKEKTVMLSTHIMQEVEAMCNRVIIINKGEMVANSAVDKIKSKEKRKTQVVKFKVNGQLNAANFKEMTINKTTNGFWVASWKQKANLAEAVFNTCVQNNLVLQHLETQNERLEDVFKELTK